MMDIDIARDLIREAAKMGVYSIKWNWRGEATLNKHIGFLTEEAKRIGIPEVQLNTNGNMRKSNVEELIDAGIDRLIFSVDGDTKETFEAIRTGGDFDELVDTIRRAVDYRKHLGVRKPFIRVQMCKQTANAHEVEAFTNRWKDIVDDVRVSQVTDRGSDGFMHIGDLVENGRAFCQQPFQRLTIGYDGKVMGCCADWFENRSVGHVKSKGLKEIWQGALEKDSIFGELYVMRDAQIKGYQDFTKPCSSCWAKDGYKWKKSKKGSPKKDSDYSVLAKFMGNKKPRKAEKVYRKSLHRQSSGNRVYK